MRDARLSQTDGDTLDGRLGVSEGSLWLSGLPASETCRFYHLVSSSFMLNVAQKLCFSMDASALQVHVDRWDSEYSSATKPLSCARRSLRYIICYQSHHGHDASSLRAFQSSSSKDMRY